MVPEMTYIKQLKTRKLRDTTRDNVYVSQRGKQYRVMYVYLYQ